MLHVVSLTYRPILKVCRNSSCSAVLSRALLSGGRLFTKGIGFYGALGQGSSLRESPTYKHVPVSPIVTNADSVLASEEDDVVKVSAGWGHSCAVTKSGKLFIFGRPFDFSNLMQLNRLSKLSTTLARFVAKSTDSGVFGKVNGYCTTPWEVRDLGFVTSVSCSAGLTVVLNAAGEVFAFGQNRWKQCGTELDEENDDNYIVEPTKIVNLPSCVSVDAGLQHCVALSDTGDIYSWGKANHGQVGVGVCSEPFSLAARVELRHEVQGVERSLKALAVRAGFSHSAALAEDGAVYVWGKGMSDVPRFINQRYHSYENQLRPRRIELPEGRRAVSIVTSNYTILVLAGDRSLWAMGWGEQDRNSYAVPMRVQTDFHGADGQRLPESELAADVSSATDVPETVYVQVPSDALLCKGHQRAALVFPSETREVPSSSAASAHAPPCVTYEVVLHNDEAYLLELPMECAPFAPSQAPSDDSVNAAAEVASAAQCRVVDVSTGWQHSLLVLAPATSGTRSLHS